MIYMDVKVEDLLNGVISQRELDFASNVRIPHNDRTGLWLKKQLIDLKIKQAIATKKVQRVAYEPIVAQRGPQVISDYTGSGINGIQSMADGKYYDSKSAYRKSLKEKGLVELGNDAPTVGKGPEASISERELKQDIKTAIEQLGG